MTVCEIGRDENCREDNGKDDDDDDDNDDEAEAD
jgi:hypothetical protein